MSEVRLLQVTDCHILPEAGGRIYGADTYQSLQSVLRAALALPKPPNLIVATGDLSEDGSEASYRRLRELFLETGLPVYVISGNHDVVDEMHRSLVGGAIREVRYLDLQSWRVVFLNSKVPGKPHGHLESSELEFLTDALMEDPQQPVAICLHHSPTRPCSSTGCHLANESAFVDLLDSHANAKLVLAGHAHLEMERRIRHATLLTTPASSSQCRHAPAGASVDHEDFWASHEFDPTRHGFRMLTLHDDGLFDTQVHWVLGCSESRPKPHA